MFQQLPALVLAIFSFTACTIVRPSYGFSNLPVTVTKQFVRTSDFVVVQRRSSCHLSMANTNMTLPETKSDMQQQDMKNPFSPFLNIWDSFATSSVYRTILFTGALFSSRSIRDFLGVPGCLAILTGTFCLYFYDTRFNYLVDVVTPKRQAALKAIRQFKTQQLSNSPTTSGENLQDLLDVYERELREELATRVLIPPNLWVIEMDPTQEDRSAARQLLGLQITDQYTLEPIVRKDWRR